MVTAAVPERTPQQLLRDEHFMRLAIALGERNLGLTWPNPSVGSVVVGENGGRPIILSQGATQAGGRPHAERVAVEAAGERARGETTYLSLQPCSHQGTKAHTADAIGEAGIGAAV